MLIIPDNDMSIRVSDITSLITPNTHTEKKHAYVVLGILVPDLLWISNNWRPNFSLDRVPSRRERETREI